MSSKAANISGICYSGKPCVSWVWMEAVVVFAGLIWSFPGDHSFFEEDLILLSDQK